MTFLRSLFAGFLALTAAACSPASDAPTASRTAEINATIALGGRAFSASGVWRVSMYVEGTRLHAIVEGDALVFEISPAERLFLVPSQQPVTVCAIREAEAKGNKDLATPAAIAAFSGPCDAEPAGGFVLARDSSGAVPVFGEFASDKRGKVKPRHGGPAEFPQVVDNILARGFAFRSLRIVATEAPLASDMIARFPWISALLRTDCGKDCSRWTNGYVYANDFTSALPPLGCPSQDNYAAWRAAVKGTQCDPGGPMPADAIKFQK